jgi:RHS repeat-associated protein
MVDASGTTSYRYDVRNRLVEKIKTWAAVGLSVALHYAYDANGNLTNLQSTSVNGAAVAYEYDPLNRLSVVNDSRLGRTLYAYDDVGNLQNYALPNGLTNTFAYDALSRLTNLSTLNPQLSTVAQYLYTLSPAGHRLTATETVASTGPPTTINRIYAYDAIYRLTGETINAGQASAGYTYDDVGNRLTRTTAGFTPGLLDGQSFSYDPNDRLTTDTYDPNGNTLLGAGFNQSQADRYDFEDRLLERRSTLNSQPSTLNLQYDGDGTRVAKTVNGLTTFYLVDELNPTGYAQVLEELTLNAQLSTLNVFRTYTHGHVLLSQDQLIDTGTNLIWQASFYGYDGHGSVRYLTDGTGQITDTYDYDAFGNLIALSGPTPNLYLFSGEQFDPDLGLYYLRARYHNPQSGRFWTADPFEGFASDPASLHRYTYAANNPVNWIDPSGNFTLPELSTAAAIRLQLGASVVSEGLITGARALATAQLLRLRYAMLDAAIEGNDALLATLQDFYGLALLANGQVNEQLDQAERALAVANLTVLGYHLIRSLRYVPDVLRQARNIVGEWLGRSGRAMSNLEGAVSSVQQVAAKTAAEEMEVDPDLQTTRRRN